MLCVCVRERDCDQRTGIHLSYRLTGGYSTYMNINFVHTYAYIFSNTLLVVVIGKSALILIQVATYFNQGGCN